VVTGYLDSAARGAGKEKQTAHDDRYDVADEYMEVVYKLWEGSWEDGAALRDRASGIFADPAKVHRIQHQEIITGSTPFTSASRRRNAPPCFTRRHLAARAAVRRRARRMCVHVEPIGQDHRTARCAIRELAAKAGRNPAEILMFSMFTIILGRTEAEASANTPTISVTSARGAR